MVIHAERGQHFAHVRENAWSLFAKQYELGARQLALGTAHCETVTLARTLSVSRNTPCRTALLRADSELHFRRSAITNVVERAHHDHPPVQESLDRIEPGSPQWWGPTPGNSLLTAGCRGARAMKTKETAVSADRWQRDRENRARTQAETRPDEVCDRTLEVRRSRPMDRSDSPCTVTFCHSKSYRSASSCAVFRHACPRMEPRS